MITKRMHTGRIRVIMSAFVLLIFTMYFCSFSYADQSPNIIYTNNDTDFSIKASELSSADKAEVKLRKSGGNGIDSSTSAVNDSIDRRLLVVYDEDFDCSQLQGLTDAVFGGNGLCVMRFDSAENTQLAYSEMQNWDQIRSVEFDSIISADDYASYEGPEAGETEPEGTEAVSGRNHLSWGAECVGTDEYSDYIDTIDHGQLILAVVDSGVDSSHPLFQSRLTAGYDFVDDDEDPDDEESHGTHITGIVADCIPEFTDIMIMPVKVLDEKAEGELSDIAYGVLYASDNGASVINLSLGGFHSSFVDTAVKKAIRNGATVVAASGNEGKDIDRSFICPAHMEEIITVGAVNEQLRAEIYSNYGKKLDVVAPGGDICSAYPNGRYIYASGTSMAAPHVSACAALLKLRYPKLDCEQICSVIKRSCNSHKDTAHYGSGIVDLKNLIAPISAQQVAPKAKNYVYTGKPIKAGIVVSRNNEKLFINDDYKVTYKNNIKIGKATAIVTGKGSYSGTKKVSFTIIPKGTSIKKIKAARRSLTLQWKKMTTQTSGYQIQYATRKNFSKAKSKTITGRTKIRTKIKKLKSGKKYYVRIRTFKTVNGKKYYSKWSKIKSIKVK